MDSPKSPAMLDIFVNTEGVRKLLYNLNPYKANGPDEVSGHFLKEAADELAEPLTFIFNATLFQGEIPNIWKEALVTPIFKPGKKDRSKAENYRPIGLTSVACKILEHII